MLPYRLSSFFYFHLYPGRRISAIRRHLREQLRFDRADPRMLNDLTTGKLAETLELALQTPGFRRRIPAHFPRLLSRDPWRALAAVRPLARFELKENPSDHLLPHPDVVVVRSGGSLGVPLYLHHTRDFTYRLAARRLRGFIWLGWRLSQPVVRLWGRGNHPHRSLHSGLRERLSLNLIHLNSTPLTSERLSLASQILRIRRGVLLEAFTNSAIALARFLLAEGTPLPPGCLRAVVVSGETLFPPVRKMLREAFSAPVYDRYGSSETGLIAQECPFHRLHLLSDQMVVEVLDRQGNPLPPGEEGQLALTLLDNPAAPLVRYLIGDLGVMGEPAPCPCGLPHPCLERVSGRDTDIILLPAGGYVSGAVFGTQIMSLPVENFLVEQTSPTRVRVSVVPSEGWTPACRRELIRRLTPILPGIEVTVETASRLSNRLGSGKRRHVVSRVGGAKLSLARVARQAAG